MKRKNFESDREKKIPRVVKTDRVVKHRKSIYNMLVEDEDDSDFTDDYGDVEDTYIIKDNNTTHTKHR